MKFRKDDCKLILSLTSSFLKVGAFTALSVVLSACDSIQGYPQDPDNSNAVIASLSTYFDPSWDAKYDLSTDPDARRQYRDVIVLNRMRAYDIEFDNFERGLYGQGNSLAVVGSLATITMGAVGGVAGDAVTKAALNVASAAVTGAEGAISKELYYQRTLPALISQMEANRTNAKFNILSGIKQPDSVYPLVQAYADLESLKAAGGIPLAISNVTQIASNNQQSAELQLEALRVSNYVPSSTETVIEAWLHAGGSLTLANPNVKKLLSWMKTNKIDPILSSVPLNIFLGNPHFENDRQRAIAELGIPNHSGGI